MMIYKKGARDDFANYRVICLLWHSYYSRTPLIRPPSKSHWCGRMRGMVARDGFVYEQKPLSVTRNVVVWEGWSLVRVVVRQGFYCSYYPLSLLADWWRYWTITCQTPRRIPTSERVQRKRSRALRWFTAIWRYTSGVHKRTLWATIGPVLREGRNAVITFIDYSAAFDTESQIFPDGALADAGVSAKVRLIIQAVYAAATGIMRCRVGWMWMAESQSGHTNKTFFLR